MDSQKTAPIDQFIHNQKARESSHQPLSELHSLPEPDPDQSKSETTSWLPLVILASTVVLALSIYLIYHYLNLT